MANPLMKCGCVALGRTAEGKPVCPVHIGILPGAEETMPIPSLEGRFAFCTCCGTKRPSDASLPFFEFGRTVRSMEEDGFYCGCRGWD